MKSSLNPAGVPGTKHTATHRDFVRRIKKTLYYGSSSAAYQCDRISRPLADYAAEMFSATHKGISLNRIDFATVSKQVSKQAPCSLIISMIYLDRLNTIDVPFVQRITPSELFLVAMFTASKFLVGYDEFVYLSEWAEYGNMSVDRLKQLELDFLDAMNWNIFVSNHEFFEKLKAVETVVAKRQGLKRGWLTYTELFCLMPTFAIAKQIFSYSAVLALSYCAGVMTIASGFLLASQVPGTSMSSSSNTPGSIDRTSNNESMTKGTSYGADMLSDEDEIETELIDLLVDDVTKSIGRYESVNNEDKVPEAVKNRTLVGMRNVNHKPPDPRLLQETCEHHKCSHDDRRHISRLHQLSHEPASDSAGTSIEGFVDPIKNCTQEMWLMQLFRGLRINPSLNTIPSEVHSFKFI